MTKRERMRRVALLCVHFARNLAFYRAGMANGKLIRNNPFWRVANFNFYDKSILAWCKLFADKAGKHYWKNIVRNKSEFELGLLKTLSLTRAEFDRYSNEMRKSRDKFIAHLDSEKTDYHPFMDKGLEAVKFYYRYLLLHEDEENNYPDFPKDLLLFYKECEALAKSEYQR
jgi:hypothetical protein